VKPLAVFVQLAADRTKIHEVDISMYVTYPIRSLLDEAAEPANDRTKAMKNVKLISAA
jgi:hypothetical protein